MVYCSFIRKKFLEVIFRFFNGVSQFRKANKIHLKINKMFFPIKVVLYAKELLSHCLE